MDLSRDRRDRCGRRYPTSWSRSISTAPWPRSSPTRRPRARLPGRSRPLTALAAAGARVAVITGRDAATAVRLGGLTTCPASSWRAVRRRDVAGRRTDHPGSPGVHLGLRARLPACSPRRAPTRTSGSRTRDLAGRPRPQGKNPDGGARAVARADHSTGRRTRPRIHPGRDVARAPAARLRQGRRVRRLASRPRACCICGDDLGDLPAFAEIRRLRADGAGACRRLRSPAGDANRPPPPTRSSPPPRMW